MDSIVSAMVVAEARGKNTLPLINIPREELSLRQDVILLFELCQVDSSTFLYREAIPSLVQAAERGEAAFFLVDHNVLPPAQKKLQPYVEAIIDHHSDEKVLYPLLDPKQKIIAAVGSNATLVARWIFENFPQKMDRKKADLLLAPLLLDTAHLTNEKTTPLDQKMAEALIAISTFKDPSAYYSLLYEKKHEEIESPSSILKKDFKIYEEGALLYGISSFPLQVIWGPETRDLWKIDLSHFFEGQNIQLWFGLQKKSIIFYTPDVFLYEKFIYLAHSFLQDVLLLKISLPKEGLAFYDLRKVISRKQLQPILNLKSLLN